MFVGQAAQQFERFTGKKAAEALMRKAVLEDMGLEYAVKL
jgi:shikimate 5-dehydrogenase